MYTRWAERRRFKVEVLEVHDGEEAGIKSATMLIKGHNAYGWLKTESGVHRLVRISPYDSNARRHTSFASVWVYPVIDDSIDIEVSESDVRIDTYRSSGSGGQHVNTTDSAVRITHLATGIAVACQAERSQHKNKAKAWEMLRSRLYEEELKKREAAANATEASKSDIGWGHQIRSYVLQPYQLVKDLRTGVENTSPSDVLDGDLDEFMEASLSQRIEGGAGQVVATSTRLCRALEVLSHDLHRLLEPGPADAVKISLTMQAQHPNADAGSPLRHCALQHQPCAGERIAPPSGTGGAKKHLSRTRRICG